MSSPQRDSRGRFLSRNTFDFFLKNVMRDVRVELDDEFDRNFERKAFFDTPWAPAKLPSNKGSLMLRTGALRSSLKSHIDGSAIRYTSSHPAAALHNEGGEITVTPKMKRFFWAMYYRAMGGITTKKDGTASRSKKNLALTEEAQGFKNLALMKDGAKIKIPQRQFIGWHPQMDTIVERIVQENVQELEQDIADQLRSAGK